MKIINYIPAWVIYPLGLMPAANYTYLAFINQLGTDPIHHLHHGFGEWALRFIIVGLAITPLMRFVGIRLGKYRRAVGLVAFAYVVLHFNVYVILDRQFLWNDIIADIIKRPYIIMGTLAFLLFLPMAITSNNLSIRKLGGKWRKLHRLVYPATILAASHYVMLQKTWEKEPVMYLFIIVMLIATRLIPKKPKVSGMSPTR